MAVVKKAEVPLQESRPGLQSRKLIYEDVGSASVTIGELILKPGAILPPHKHLAEEAFYTLEGSGQATVGEETFDVEPETALLAPAGVPHGFKNSGEVPWRMLYIYPVIQPKAEFV